MIVDAFEVGDDGGGEVVEIFWVRDVVEGGVFVDMDEEARRAFSGLRVNVGCGEVFELSDFVIETQDVASGVIEVGFGGCGNEGSEQ